MVTPHVNAHAHNDYEHPRPLMDALSNGFTSVEADVHLKNGKLLVSHNQPKKSSATIGKLYLHPLDSLLKKEGFIYPNSESTFYLMIDCKTESMATYDAIKKELSTYTALKCIGGNCRVRIFLSGNRPVNRMISEGYSGIGIDGRPDDIGKGYTSDQMPVISDNFRNWSSWSSKAPLADDDVSRVRELASKIHAEGKKFRLWAIPDDEVAWGALLEAGVDFINTDKLAELNAFLLKHGL